MVVQLEHAQLEIVADFVNQLNFQERLPTNKVPHHALLAELILLRQHIVNKLLRRLPRHPLLHILPHQIAILTSQLAVLRDYERDVLRHAILPCRVTFFYFRWFHKLMNSYTSTR